MCRKASWGPKREHASPHNKCGNVSTGFCSGIHPSKKLCMHLGESPRISQVWKKKQDNQLKVNKDQVSQVMLLVKNLTANAGDGDLGLIPVLGRSPGVENGCPLQYSCLENSTVSGASQATVHRVTKSQTWLNTHTQTHTPGRTVRYKGFKSPLYCAPYSGHLSSCPASDINRLFFVCPPILCAVSLCTYFAAFASLKHFCFQLG